MNPASRAFARQSRRAQNDVLSTVGVCVYVDEHGKIVANSNDGENATPGERDAALRTIHENENGLMLEVFDVFLGYATSMFMINVRKRIQVCCLLRAVYA